MPIADYTHEQQESLRWNDPELITPSDLNNAQRLRERRALDHLLWNQLIEGGVHQDIITSDGQMRPIGSGFAIAQNAPSPNMSVWIKRGCVLYQQPSEGFGGPAKGGQGSSDEGAVEPTVLAHAMDSDLQVTIDPAHATLTRFDRIAYKVEYDAADVGSGPHVETRASKTAAGNVVSQILDKRRRTLLTVRYVPGTPGSGVPGTPGGFHRLADITVPALDTTIGQSQIQDWRTPAGTTKICVPRSIMKAVGTWTESLNGWTVSGASQELRIPIPLVTHWLSGEDPIGSLADPLGSGGGRWTGLDQDGGFRNLRLGWGSVAINLDTSPTGTLSLWRGHHSFTASAQVLDLALNLGVVDAVAGVYSGDIGQGGNEAAIWSNGRTSPVNVTTGAGQAEDFLFGRLVSGSASDELRGLSLTFYGV